MENLLRALFRHDCPDEEELVNYSHASSRASMSHQDRQRVQQHLQKCSRCSESYEGYMAISESSTPAAADLLHRIEGVAKLIASTIDNAISPPQQARATRGAQSHNQVYALPHDEGEILITLTYSTTEAGDSNVLHAGVGLAGRDVIGVLMRDGHEVARGKAHLPEALAFENLDPGIYDLNLLEEAPPGLDILIPGIQVGEVSD